MRLVAVLEAGRRDFLNAARNVAPPGAGTRPKPNSWSVLECIEHVVAVEDRYLSWISTGAAVPPRRDADKEIRLFTTIRNRLTKVEAPDVFRPAGRFATLAAALADLEAVRNRSVRVVEERGQDLYSIGMTHPWFGALNAVELLQLIDGHARRHADQIREICEELQARTPRPGKRTTPGKSAASRRDPPDLAAELDCPADPDALFSDPDSVIIHEQRLQDVDRAGLRVQTFRLEASVLERVQLAGGQFGAAVWKDVRLVGCDLANIRVHRMNLVRVELIDCRLTGFCATALHWQDVLIQNVDARYAQCPGGTFRTCEFDACNCQEADLQGADLTGSIFRSCNLAMADLNGARLQNADFRTSQIDSMLVGMNDVRGAMVDPAQAMVLARLLGLQIL